MPNVSIQQQTAGPSMGAIFIRGIGSADVEKTTPPQVGVVVDGIFMATNTGQLIDMFDVDQMEVNRGPQGVLYGKNTTGGTIVVRRSQPQFNDFDAKASVEGGTFNEEIYKGKVNIPLIDDKLALKLAGMYDKRDGVYRQHDAGDRRWQRRLQDVQRCAEMGSRSKRSLRRCGTTTSMTPATTVIRILRTSPASSPSRRRRT